MENENLEFVKVLNTNEINRFFDISKALGNKTRLKLITFLIENPGCITGKLVDYLPLAQSTISQHLVVLKKANLISGTVQGPATSYCLNYDTLNEYKDLIIRLVGFEFGNTK